MDGDNGFSSLKGFAPRALFSVTTPAPHPPPPPTRHSLLRAHAACTSRRFGTTDVCACMRVCACCTYRYNYRVLRVIGKHLLFFSFHSLSGGCAGQVAAAITRTYTDIIYLLCLRIRFFFHRQTRQQPSLQPLITIIIGTTHCYNPTSRF